MAIKDKACHDRVMQEIRRMEEAMLHEIWQMRAEKNALIRLAQSDEETSKLDHGLKSCEWKNHEQIVITEAKNY